MEENNVLNYIKKVVENMPTDWVKLTTHRLDIYEEELAKSQFLDRFELLFEANDASLSSLKNLPTAYDYIRLGHPLSSILEWGMAKMQGINAEDVICFSSKTVPILAVLRKNLMNNKKTLICYSGDLPAYFDAEVVKKVYGYSFELKEVNSAEDVPSFDGSTLFISQQDDFHNVSLLSTIDFFVSIHSGLGSVLLINGEQNENYIADIQHVRRRETISMTPPDCHTALQHFIDKSSFHADDSAVEANKNKVVQSIQEITGTKTNPLMASCGLSTQYAIMMGLVHDALDNHKEKPIRFLVPPNCYGGTNDQARRVAACNDNIEVVDLPVDGDNDMVQSLDRVLDQMAKENAVSYIIAEIPTNPRVEVPDLQQLKTVLCKERYTTVGKAALPPVFILDQTFCPNYHFLGEDKILSSVRTIAYVSGSKFPSGGLCTAGYCVANQKAEDLMEKIELHLKLCDNEATHLQLEILAKQLPSMNQRIKDAYINTRDFVNFIHKNLPAAKINFVSEELAEQGFTPSVFSLDLPTKGETDKERETYKRALNLKLIHSMISEIPAESKFCVSYGQLKGCYWTVPATSTQGTTKEDDKDYIVRVSVSGHLDLDRHKEVFLDFIRDC